MDTPLQRADALFDLVQSAASEADELRHLPGRVGEAFANSGLYRMSVPAAYGGEGADPTTQIRTIERISQASGSAGWNLMIGIENFGLLAPAMHTCAELLEDPNIVLCSSTAAVGEAREDGDGYRVSGQWPFVSGCHNAQLFGATVSIGGQNAYAVVPEGDWRILDTWYVGGLRGSGSHDVVVENAYVPAKQIVAPLGGTRSDDPLLRFPVGARLSYNKVAVALGIAQAAIDAYAALAAGKVPRFTSRKLAKQSHAQRAMAEAVGRVTAARHALLSETESMWRKACDGEKITAHERAVYQIVCSQGVRGCNEAVDLLADAAGTSANRLDHPLERLSRDIRVVRQHATVGSQHIEDAGRLLLGEEATGLMLAMPADRE